MKLNINGLVESQSVQNAERILLKRKENETMKLKLANARNNGKVVKSIQREKMFHRISSNYLFLLALS